MNDLERVLQRIASAETLPGLRSVAEVAKKLLPADQEVARWAYAYAAEQLRERHPRA